MHNELFIQLQCWRRLMSQLLLWCEMCIKLQGCRHPGQTCVVLTSSQCGNVLRAPDLQETAVAGLNLCPRKIGRFIS